VRIRRSRLTKDFLQVPNATVRDDRMSHMARGILAELLSRPDGWQATADDMWRASVAKHGKASPGRRQFRAAFAELKKCGYLSPDLEPMKGGQISTVLLLTDVPHVGTSARPANSRKTAGQTDVPHGGTSESDTDVPDGGTSEPPAETNETAGQAEVPHGGTSASPAETGLSPARTDVPHGGTSKEEDGETKTGKKTSSLPAPALTPLPGIKQPDHHLAAFGAFWVNYPRKRDREEAKQAWIAAIERGVDPQHMVDAALTYARERAGQEPQFTKYPATWLNKGCYDDEPETADQPRLRAVGDYQPWTNPNDQSGYYEEL
jgi:hypothetical protein